MDGVCQCGNYKCLVQIYWKGKYYEYRRDDQNYVFTYDKAKDKLIEINNAIRKGTFDPLDHSDAKIQERRFENMIEKWLNEKESRYRLNELSYGTIRDYRGYAKNYYQYFAGHDVREIDLEKLSEFKDTINNVKIKTRKNIMNALRNFFNWLQERGTIQFAPAFPKITGDDSKMRVAIDYELQEEGLSRIPKNITTIFIFLLETGVRPGDACAVMCESVDLREGSVRIERTFSSNKLQETTKQRKKRVILLSDRAYEAVERNMKNKLPKQFLFIHPDTHRHYLTNTLWRIWRTHSKIDVTNYEATRHSFASQLIEQYDIKFVKELMGHSDIRTTEKYLHLKQHKLREIVNNRGKIRVLNRSEIEVKNDTN